MADPENRITPFYGYPYPDPRYLPQVIPYRSHIFPNGSPTPPHLQHDYQNYERLRYVQGKCIVLRSFGYVYLSHYGTESIELFNQWSD